MLNTEPATDVLEAEPMTGNIHGIPEDCVTFEQFKNDFFRLLKQRYEAV